MSERSERMEITSTALLDDIDLALRANNNGAPISWRQDMCMCDPSVGMVPCQYCAIQNALEKCKRFLSSNVEFTLRRASGDSVQLMVGTTPSVCPSLFSPADSGIPLCRPHRPPSSFLDPTSLERNS